MTPRARRALAAGAIYATLLLAVGARLGTWTDEEYTLGTTAHGVAYAWNRAIGFELQAPLYFAILAAWRAVDGSVWFARLFSVLCALGTYAALLRVGRRVAPGRDPLPFALLASCNPYAVFAAFEIRLYALALLLSAVLWLLFDAGFLGGSRRAARGGFVAVAVAALYVQYFVGFALVGYGAALAVARRRALAPYAAACAAVAIAIVPLALVARTQVGGSGVLPDSAGAILRTAALHPWLEMVLPYERGWDALRSARPAYELFAVGLALALAALRPRVGPRGAALLAAAGAIELAYLAVAVGLRLDLHERHYVALFVPLLAGAYAVVDALGRGAAASRRTGALAVAGCAALGVLALLARYAPLAREGDPARVAAWLARNGRPGDVAGVFPADELPAYARVYRGPVALVPFPVALSPDRYEPARIAVASAAEVREALARLPRTGRRFLVLEGPADPRSDLGGRRILRAELVRDAAPVLRARYYEARIVELGRARPAR